MNTTSYCIELNSDDLFQILDGLEIRAEAWETTERCLLTDEPQDGLVEECSDACEAHQIAIPTVR